MLSRVTVSIVLFALAFCLCSVNAQVVNINFANMFAGSNMGTSGSGSGSGELPSVGGSSHSGCYNLTHSVNQLDSNILSANVLAFVGNDLIIGDSLAGTLWSVAVTPQSDLSKLTTVNYFGLKRKITKLLGSTSWRVMDAQLHPVTKEPFIAIHVKCTPESDLVVGAADSEDDREDEMMAMGAPGSPYRPIIVAVGANGTVYLPQVRKLNSYSGLDPVDTRKLSHYGQRSLRWLAIAEIVYFNNSLLVSGMSNSGNATSVIYTVPYPFPNTCSVAGVTRLEMYHPTHVMMERNIPVRAMTVVNNPANNQPVIVSSYVCMPITLFNLNDVKNGAYVTGKTIGDIGYGNTPVDVLSFQAADSSTGAMTNYVIMTSENKGAYVFSVSQLLSAPAVAQGVASNFLPVGITNSAFPVPMSGIVKLMDFNSGYLISLRRELQTGELSLLTYQKGLYFRLSDHYSEFEVPQFSYTADNIGWKDLQMGFLRDENYVYHV